MSNGYELLNGGAVVLCLITLGLILKENSRFRSEANDMYTHKDVCDVVHTQVSTDLAEIKADIKKLLTKNGIK